MLARLFNFGMLAPDDGIPDLGGFESDDGDLAEFIELGPGEDPPVEEEEDDDRVVLSKAELEELKKSKGGGDSSMLEGLISGLKDAIQPGQKPVELEQQAGESDEEFNKRIVEELFDRDNGGDALQRAIERYTGKEKAQLLGILSEQNKQLLELNPRTAPMFDRYGKEIEKKVQELPANQRLHPNAWKWALDQVKLAHADDIQQDNVDKLVDERVKAALRAHGIEDDDDDGLVMEPQAKTRKAAVGTSLGRGRGTANVRTNGKKSGRAKVFYTAEDARIAKEKMVPLEQYLRSIGKL